MPQPDPNVEPLKDTDAAKIREAVAALSRADKKKARRKPETPQDVADAGSDNETHLKPQLTEAPAISDALRRAEAMLFASAQPISAEELASSLPQGADVAQILMELKALTRGGASSLSRSRGNGGSRRRLIYPSCSKRPARSNANCPEPRSKRWQPSLIANPLRGPRSKMSAAWPSHVGHWTS